MLCYFDFLLVVLLLLDCNPIGGDGHLLCQELYDLTPLHKPAVGGQGAQGGARGVQAETLTSQQLQASFRSPIISVSHHLGLASYGSPIFSISHHLCLASSLSRIIWDSHHLCLISSRSCIISVSHHLGLASSGSRITSVSHH